MFMINLIFRKLINYLYNYRINYVKSKLSYLNKIQNLASFKVLLNVVILCKTIGKLLSGRILDF